MIEVYYLDDGLKKAEMADLEKLKGKPLWVDVENITEAEGKILREVFGLHPLTIEDLSSTEVRIKVEEFPNYLFCIFYGIKGIDKLIELDFIIGKDFLITHHREDLLSFSHLKSKKNKVANSLKRGPDFLFHDLLDDEIDNFFPVIDKLEDKIDELEKLATDNPYHDVLTQILDTKQEVLLLRRALFSQREKLSFITKGRYQFISKKVLPYLRDVYDHSVRVLESTDSCRGAVRNAYDAYMSSMSNRMNEVMKTLSIIATIALPLTVISGIWGTNFDFLPGQHSIHGFAFMITLMLAVIGMMLFIFKRRKWF